MQLIEHKGPFSIKASAILCQQSTLEIDRKKQLFQIIDY